MSQYLEMAKKLRLDPQVHYNCAQGVLLPFAKEKGLDFDLAYAVCGNLNAGLRCGATCGAILGGLMVLGLYGCTDPATVSDYYKRVKANHDGMTQCADLLRVNAAQGREKKPHCDEMVYECVEIAEAMLRERNIISVSISGE